MAIMPVREVWGVGSRINKKLNSLGIKTALQLSELDTKLIKRKFLSPIDFQIYLRYYVQKLGDTCAEGVRHLNEEGPRREAGPR